MSRAFVLSTVGTSLLTNQLKEHEQRKQLNGITNEQTLTPEAQALVMQLLEQAEAAFIAGNTPTRRRLSAELNGLISFYGGDLKRGAADVHLLLTTDTALGRATADALRRLLTAHFAYQNVQVDAPAELSTASRRAFREGIQNLLKSCEETLPGYRTQGYRIVFNLTGGFKAIQGYLNTIGMFYADELVYIFERTEELLRIPRLPIRVDTAPFEAHAAQFALMAQGEVIPLAQLPKLPGGLLEVDDKGDAMLSEWGLLSWNRVREDILSEHLLPLPRLDYERSFEDDFGRASRDKRLQLQETLVKVACLLERANGDTTLLKQDGGLQYEDYRQHKAPNGRPIGHFRVSQALRVSCVAEGGTMTLRRFGREPDVNQKP